MNLMPRGLLFNGAVFFVALIALLALEHAGHSTASASAAPTSWGVAQESGSGGKLPPNIWSRKLEAGKWHLGFEFYDSKGVKHATSCVISDSEHQGIVDRQGFYEEAKAGELNATIIKIVTRVADSLSVGENGCAVPAHWVGPDWTWKSEVPSDHDFDERKKKFEDWLKKDYGAMRKEARELWAHKQDCPLPAQPQGDPELRKINAVLASAMTAKATELKLKDQGAPSPSRRIGSDWVWRPVMSKTEEFKEHKKKFLEWFGSEYVEMRTAQENQYMKERGFRWDEIEGWVLDYSSLVQQASPAFSDCLQNLRGEIGRDPEALMAFFVAMPRLDIPRVNPDGKYTQGFRVPTSVLIENSGDCDSKAAAFCVIWGDRSEHLVIFRTYPLPKVEGNEIGHALIGVEAYVSGGEDPKALALRNLVGQAYQRPVEVNNRYYWPCEVGGPGWNDFKSVAKERGGDYEAIPIRPLETVIAATAPRTSPLPPPGSPPPPSPP